MQLRNQDAKGAQLHCAEKTRTNVRDLYTRIWVSLRAAESRSDRLQKLQDGELSVKNKTQVSLVFFHVLRPQLSNDQFSAVLLTALFTFFLN